MNKILKKGWSILLATAMGATALAGGILTAPTASADTTIDASSLEQWTVYDTYNYTDTNTKPADWDTTINKYGRRPWFYFKDGCFYNNDNYKKFHNTYDINWINNDESTYLKVISSYPRVFKAMQHTYTNQDKDNPVLTFLGYGEDDYYFTNFALAPIEAKYKDDLKTISFDIDAANTNAHTLSGFGVLINAGVTNDVFKGHVLNFKMADNGVGTKTGTIYLEDYSVGVDAKTFHLPTSAFKQTNPLKNADGSNATFNLATGTGVTHVDLDITPNQVTIKTYSYLGGGAVSETKTYNASLATTGEYQFGPVVQFMGTGHGCDKLSYVQYSNLKMSVNYTADFYYNYNEGGKDKGKYTSVENIPPIMSNGIITGYNSLEEAGKSMPADPTRPGYTFQGWATTKDAKTPDFDKDSKIDSYKNIYAVWTKNITFGPGVNGKVDGADPNGSKTTTDQRDGDKVKFPDVTPDPGYAFDEWVQVDESGQETPITDPSNVIVDENTNKFVPKFDKDDNGDGIPDKRQYKHTVVFASDSRGALDTTSLKQYDLLTGDTRKPVSNPGSLSFTWNMASVKPLVIPTVIPKTGYMAKDWENSAGGPNATDSQIPGLTFIGANGTTTLTVQYESAGPRADIAANNPSGYTKNPVPVNYDGGCVIGMSHYEVKGPNGLVITTGNTGTDVKDIWQATTNGDYTITVIDIEGKTKTSTCKVDTLDRVKPEVGYNNSASKLEELAPDPKDVVPGTTNYADDPNDKVSDINNGKTVYSVVDTVTGLVISGSDWNSVVSQTIPGRKYEVYVYAEDNAGNGVDATASNRPDLGVQIPNGPYGNGSGGNNGGGSTVNVSVVGGDAVLTRLRMNGVLTLSVEGIAQGTNLTVVGTTGLSQNVAVNNGRISVRLTTGFGFSTGQNTLVIQDGGVDVHTLAFSIK